MTRKETMDLIEVEAAMCLWEEFLAARTAGTLHHDLVTEWESYGTSAIRLQVRDIAPKVEELWASFSMNEQDALAPFDWEFVPVVVGLMSNLYELPTKDQVIERYKEMGRL